MIQNAPIEAQYLWKDDLFFVFPFFDAFSQLAGKHGFSTRAQTGPHIRHVRLPHLCKICVVHANLDLLRRSLSQLSHLNSRDHCGPVRLRTYGHDTLRKRDE